MMSISILIGALALARSVQGFTFSHSNPAECQDFTLRWEGGRPPFYATIVPAYPITGARIQNVSIPTTSSSSPYTYSFRLDNPAGLEFSVIMSDATGWGAGGVTPVLQIDPSSDQSCHSTPPPFGFYFYWDPPMAVSQAQCQTMRLSWDAGLTYPIQALGFVPGSAAFTIPVPQNPSTLTTTWPVAVREGAQYQILMAHSGQVATGGSTNLTWVTAGSSACLGPNSPGPGVRIATVISSGTSTTMTMTSSRSSASMSSSAGPGSNNSGGGLSGSGGGSNAGAIAGGVVGGIAALALVLLLLFCCRRKRQRERQNMAVTPAEGRTIDGEPEMRQSSDPLSMAPAAVMRRATRSMGNNHSRHASRSSFDILSRPAGAARTPPPPDTPSSLGENDVDPFVSPFPAPPARASFDRDGPNAVAWGASREHLRDMSSGSEGLNADGISLAPLVPGAISTPIATGSTNRQSRKVSGQFTETPPLTPTTRPGSQLPSTNRSPVYRSPSSGGLNRWSVDEDPHVGSIGSGPMSDRISDVEEGKAPRRQGTMTTFVQHDDAGPGGVVELPPSYHQLRARNPDED